MADTGARGAHHGAVVRDPALVHPAPATGEAARVAAGMGHSEEATEEMEDSVEAAEGDMEVRDTNGTG